MEDRNERSRRSLGELLDRFEHHLEEANRRWQEDWGYHLPAPEHTHVDLLERDDAFVVLVDLPGRERAAVDVTLVDRILRIEVSGDERVPPATGGSDADAGDRHEYVRRERAHGPRSRRVRLPGPVTAADATARLDAGVLTVVLPKATSGGEGSIEVE
jgi:HSP20 family protein